MFLYYQKYLWPAVNKQKRRCPRVFSGIERGLGKHRKELFNPRIVCVLENVGTHLREKAVLTTSWFLQNVFAWSQGRRVEAGEAVRKRGPTGEECIPEGQRVPRAPRLFISPTQRTGECYKIRGRRRGGTRWALKLVPCREKGESDQVGKAQATENEEGFD